MEFNVADLIERVASNVPEREAVVCGEQRATYRHFDETANRFARHLLGAGLGKGDHVGIYGYNSIEWIEAMIACYKIGAVPININFRYVEEELFYIFNDANLKAVVYDAEFAANIERIRSRLPLLQHLIYLDTETGNAPAHVVDGSIAYSEACRAGADVTFPERSADDHYVLYTGGTTGMPKGVVWRQGDAVMVFGGGIDAYTQETIESPEKMADRCLDAGHFPLTSLNSAPLMHGAAQWMVLRSLFEGGTTILLSGRSYDPHEVWRKVETEGVHAMTITGDAMARPLMDALIEGHREPDRLGQPYDTSSMLAFASTAAVFSPSLKDAFADKIPNVVITDSIGSSESGFNGLSVHEKGKAQTNAGGPRVNPARNVVILDEDFREIPAGDERVGVLAKGGFTPLGYYNDPAKSAETFVTAPDGKRYVITGDMARHNADGSVTMLGRGSQCINSGGEKIYPEEVEAAIKAHPAVFDTLVAATPDERFGQCVTALVQLQDGAEPPSLESIQDACDTHIARYKVPRRIYFVDKVQRAPSGKADYRWAKQEASRRFEAEAPGP